MTNAKLKALVKQEFDNPYVLGVLACNLYDNEPVQQHKDGRELQIFWRDTGDFWRFTIFSAPESELCMAQVDLHKDRTVRFEAYEACSLTVSYEDGIAFLRRFSKP
jgi:hypothetical protein